MELSIRFTVFSSHMGSTRTLMDLMEVAPMVMITVIMITTTIMAMTMNMDINTAMDTTTIMKVEKDMDTSTNMIITMVMAAVTVIRMMISNKSNHPNRPLII